MFDSANKSKNKSEASYKYWAFISYSHKDEKWASWLHKSLERYRIPHQLVGHNTLIGRIPKRLFPVFRDQEELPSSSNLTDEIREALRNSRCVIVVCSPNSAVSRWVDEEVKFFKALGRENHVLCLLVEGEPNASFDPNSGLLEAFPKAVQFKVGPDQRLTSARSEPLAADVRKKKGEKNNAKLKLIAGILGIGYDELKQRDKRRKRRLQLLSAITAITLVVIATFFWARVSMERTKEARINSILRTAKESADPLLSSLLLTELDSEQEPPDGLAVALNLWSTPIPSVIFRGHSAPIYSAKDSMDGSAVPSVESAMFSPDGSRVVTASEDWTARVWNTNGEGNHIILRGHKDAVRSATFSPDGSKVLTSSDDTTARVWRADGSGNPVVLAGHEGALVIAVFSPDGSHIATGSYDGTVRVWNTKGTSTPVVLQSPDYNARSIPTVAVHADKTIAHRVIRAPVTNVTFSPDGSTVIGIYQNSVIVWPTDGRSAAKVLKEDRGYITKAFFGSKNSEVITVSDNGLVRVWSKGSEDYSQSVIMDKSAGNFIALSYDRSKLAMLSRNGFLSVRETDGTNAPVNLGKHNGKIASAEFSRDGSRLITISFDGAVHVWRTDGAYPSTMLMGHNGPITCAKFNPQSTSVVTTSKDGTARLWEIDGSNGPMIMHGHKKEVKSVAFDSMGTRLITASSDGTAKVWLVKSGTLQLDLKKHKDKVWSAAFSPNGAFIVTASEDKTARVWLAGMEEAVLPHPSSVSKALFLDNGSHVITSAGDGKIRVWRVKPTEELFSVQNHSGGYLTFALSPDGLRFATAGQYGRARIWRLDKRENPISLEGHKAGLLSIAFSPDSSRVVTTSEDSTVRIWSVDGKTKPVILSGHEDVVMSAAFSPDGSLLVTASLDSTARVWRTDGTGEPIIMRGHKKGVWKAAFLPDGLRIVTASLDGTARIWSVDGKGTPAILSGHHGAVWDVAFDPEGFRFATASEDSDVRVWPVDWSYLVKRIRESTTACLTTEQREHFLKESTSEAKNRYISCEGQYGRGL